MPVEASYEEVAYQFTAGILEHAGALTAVLAPTVNSYKRLLPVGLMNEISWAPVFRAYGHNNRTLMLRLPVSRRWLLRRGAVEQPLADTAWSRTSPALMPGAGRRGSRHLPPGPRSTHLELLPGDCAESDLLAQANRGASGRRRS